MQKEKLHLTPEQQTLLQKTYDSFVDNGANLNAAKKAVYRKLSQQLDTASLAFDRNVLKEINDYFLVVTDKSQLSGLSDDYLEMAASKAVQKGKTGWIIDLTAPSYMPAMFKGIYIG